MGGGGPGFSKISSLLNPLFIQSVLVNVFDFLRESPVSLPGVLLIIVKFFSWRGETLLSALISKKILCVPKGQIDVP